MLFPGLVDTEATKGVFRAPQFRAHLQDVLLARCRANRQYSLRAFARSLKIEPSALSKILREKRAISIAMFEKLSERLGLAAEEKDRFFTSQAPNRSYDDISVESFRVISDWYHFAILDLMRLSNFESSPKWIASALGISVAEVNVALERLRKLGLAQTDERGNYSPCPNGQTTVGNSFTAPAFKAYQRQVLEKAIEALLDVPIKRRDQSALTMAIDSERLAEAKQRIKQFRRELCEFLEGSKLKDEVYHLVISLYPVTHFTEGNTKV